jgi:hypothetical protein
VGADSHKEMDVTIKSTRSTNSPHVDDKVVDEFIQTMEMCTEKKLSKMTAYPCKQILKVRRVFTDRYYSLDHFGDPTKDMRKIHCGLAVGYVVDYLARID